MKRKGSSGAAIVAGLVAALAAWGVARAATADHRGGPEAVERERRVREDALVALAGGLGTGWTAIRAGLGRLGRLDLRDRASPEPYRAAYRLAVAGAPAADVIAALEASIVQDAPLLEEVRPLALAAGPSSTLGQGYGLVSGFVGTLQRAGARSLTKADVDAARAIVVDAAARA